MPASVQPAAPSTIPTPSTAIPPAMPAWPNQRAILRARQAASDEPMIAVAAHADAGAASSGVAEAAAPAPAARGTRSRRARRRSRRSRPGRSGRAGAQARDEPEVGERGAGEERRRGLPVVRPEHERGQRERDVDVAECRQPWPASRARSYNIPRMKPTLVQYEAPGFGVGEVWLERRPRLPLGAAAAARGHVQSTVDGSERRRPCGQVERVLRRRAGRLRRRRLGFEDGFYGACARALRTVPRGEVVTYGELAALAGRPGRRARRRHVLRTQRPLAVRPDAPRRRRGRASARTATSASTTSGGCSRSKA